MGNNQLFFESFFKRSFSANDTAEFLTALTKEHPYFTAAQFFLLQKTPPDTTKYSEQAAKTSILFNNPLWLNFQLGQFSATTFLPAQIDESLQQNNHEIEHGEAINNAQEIVYDSDKKEKILDENLMVPQDESSQNLFSQTEVIIPDKLKETTEQPFYLEDTKVNGFENTNGSFKHVTPDYSSEEQEGDYQHKEDEEVNEMEIEPMNIKLNFTPAIATTQETIFFEPLHTSDYFASLGIKLNEIPGPDDKLGKQLKSFTEWLKTMKKIHEDKLPAATEKDESIIKNMAEKSNAEGDVLTETMAEVLLQQGKAGKAIDVYQKLSLLNPSKSAYFAAKISQIDR